MDVDGLGAEGPPLWGPASAAGAAEPLGDDLFAEEEVSSLEAGQGAMEAAARRPDGPAVPVAPLPSLVALSVEQCVQSVRSSWATVGAPGAEGAGPDGPLTVSHADPPPVRTPTELLLGAPVVDNTWTHLEVHPDHRRSRVLAREDARDLYTGCGLRSFRRLRMGIMERVLSSVTRLSLGVRFATRVTSCDEGGRMAGALAWIGGQLYTALGVPEGDLLRRCCIVLRPDVPADADPQRYVLHWPQIALRRAEFTEAWVHATLGVGDCLADTVTEVQPRNVAPYVPMYGCVEAPSGEAPLLAWAVHRLGRLEGDVKGALAAWVTAVHAERPPGVPSPIAIGVGLRLPEVPSRRTMGAVLPLLCSINPMGAPCLDVPGAAPPGVLESVLRGFSGEERALGERLIRMLRRLAPERRREPRRQNHVGGIVYDLAGGATLGLVVWVAWIKGWALEGAAGLHRGQLLDYLEQWRMFGVGGGAARAYGAELRLRALLEQDLSPADRRRAVEEDIAELHRARGHPGPVGSRGTRPRATRRSRCWAA